MMATTKTQAAPALRRGDLRQLEPTRRQVPTTAAGPMLAFPGDGRFALNTAAVALISPKGDLRAVNLFLADRGDKRYLVVEPAKRGAPKAISVYGTGLERGEAPRGPVLVQGRAIGLIYQTLGLVNPVRFRGVHDTKHNWIVFPLDEPLPYRFEGSTNPLGDVLASWLEEIKNRPRPVTIKVTELMRELSDHAHKRGVPFPYGREPATPLGAYLRLHADELRRKHKLTVDTRFASTRAVVTID